MNNGNDIDYETKSNIINYNATVYELFLHCLASLIIIYLFACEISYLLSNYKITLY